MKIALGCLLFLTLPNFALGGSFTKMDATTIYFEGMINPGDAKQLKSLINEKTKLLIVQSPGGLSWEAQEMGQYIRDADLDVVVQGSCMSACANSLFLSGKNKYLSESFRIDRKMYDFGGIVCFHGGAVGRIDEALVDMKQLKPSYLKDIKAKGKIELFGKVITNEKEFDDLLTLIEKTNQRELDFLKSQKIDPKILLIHKTVGAEFACPTAAALTSLGVSGVQGEMAKKYVPHDAQIYEADTKPATKFPSSKPNEGLKRVR